MLLCFRLKAFCDRLFYALFVIEYCDDKIHKQTLNYCEDPDPFLLLAVNENAQNNGHMSQDGDGQEDDNYNGPFEVNLQRKLEVFISVYRLFLAKNEYIMYFSTPIV